MSAQDLLASIKARVEAARERHEEMWQEVNASRRPVLLSRTQHDRQRLLRDSTAMHAALTAVLEVHRMRRAVPGLHGDVCAECLTPYSCKTVAAVEAVLQSKGGRS
jgi:hypothetical protein